MRIRLALCVLALVLFGSAGCSARSHPVAPSPDAVAREPIVRVTRRDGSRVTLYQPRVLGDTLRGIDITGGRADSVFVATRDTREVRSVRMAANDSNWLGSTTAVLLAVGVVGTLLLVLVAAHAHIAPISL